MQFAVKLFPNKNRIVADFGTATTICPKLMNFQSCYEVRLCMESLEKHKLPSVNIVKPKHFSKVIDYPIYALLPDPFFGTATTSFAREMPIMNF